MTNSFSNDSHEEEFFDDLDALLFERDALIFMEMRNKDVPFETAEKNVRTTWKELHEEE